MKTLLVLSLIIFCLGANAQPIANAGPDQTIYLTQTNSVTLDGSASSGDSYQWTEVSTDYKSGSNITSPNSAVTTVTGLKQGVWYFQLAVTSGSSTTTDIVVIKVDYDIPPSNGTLLRSFSDVYPKIQSIVNDRHNTTDYIPTEADNIHFPDGIGSVFFDRSRLPDEFIDNQNGKFYSIVSDGYGWRGNDYARSEVHYGGSSYPIDTAKTYLFEWKGYFPQDLAVVRKSSALTATIIMQIHGNDGNSPPIELLYYKDSLGLSENWNNGNGSNGTPANPSIELFKGLLPITNLYNSTHTIRLTIKEGKGFVGQTAFIKIEFDGTRIYYRNNGQVGQTFGNDYIKFATIYDYNNNFADPNNKSRGRQVSLVTESFNIFSIVGTTNQSPNANAGANQSITLPTNTVNLSGSGSDPDGTIASYQWSKISGPSSGSIENDKSSSTSASGLIQGVYQFQLTVTDNKGATGKSTMQVTVNSSSNQPPTANAGANESITLPVNNVSLSGSGNDPDGTITSYLWTKISGPSTYTIANPSSASTNVSGLVQGSYTFQLKVTDNNGANAVDTVHITVNAANQPPTANAGANQIITLPTNSVSLSGSGSDIDGTIASYLWTKISGPSTYTIGSPNSATTNVSGLVQGVYYFQLAVTDNSGDIGTASVRITVNAATNQPPSASAGSNQTITLPTNSINLSGSGSDSDGTIASYQWTKISGPSTFTIGSPNSATTNVTGLVQGVYQFQLTVTDNSGDIGSDNVQVIVNAAENIPPTANAGSNKSITLPTSSVSLAGSGSDTDGTIASYKWTKISGPSTFTIASPNSATTNVSGLVQGVYQFQLTVTDNNGDIGSDNVQVIVNAKTNTPPTANAGSNQTIILPINSVSLAGSGSDADGTIASYEWTKISGPTTFTIVAPNSAATNVTGLVQGVYQFQLTITDDKGEKGTANVQVAVNATPSIPPIADAGSNSSITLPTNIITLTGSGSDADGTIASYKWSKISGPSTFNIVNPTSPVTDVSELVQGIYQFQLTVTDNDGNIGTGLVKITVNAAPNIPPIANAGSNKSITLPTNNVNLSGSGSDADGTIASYQWTKISGPSSFIIANPNSATTNVSGLVQGTYQFRLTVTDNDGTIGIASVRVTVNAAANIPPTASAGSNKSITLPTNIVNLSGSGSDADGTIVSYQWTKISGPSTFNIVNANSPVTDVSELVNGVYHFQLTVTDNNGGKGTSTVQVNVNAAANIPPIANAGSNKSITLPANSISLAGSGSDGDGTISSYKWAKISGPSSFNIVNASSPVTDVSGLVQGVYKFQLTVTDNKGDIGTATVQITVNAAANIPPTAEAGSNKSITLPTNSVSLAGSGSDADGTISSYKWAKISGPSFFNIVNVSSPVTDVSGLVQGIYKFQLTVTDNKGDVGTAIVQITVNAAANKPPTADAGSNMSITLPTNSVNLAGSGSDEDGTIASYKWTKISGPSLLNIATPNLPTTNVTGLMQGVYKFQLTVTDNKGDIGSAIVQITVNAPANKPPTADAGSNKSITLPTNSVSLTGSGSDADGTITSYQWTKISGPSSYNIANPNTASANITGLVQGVYQFQLTVTDNKGDKGTATVQVIVNNAVTTNVTTNVATSDIAPVANAGNDTTIISPENSVALIGSGTDADGKVVGYLWNQIAGPTNSTISSNNTAATNISNLVEGTYEFELRVTNNRGSVGKDTVSVTVALGRFARQNNSLKVYPNPVHDIATLKINTGKNNVNLMIVITDMNGKTVYRQESVSSLTETKLQIDMSNLIKGTYVITAFFDGMEKQSVKVVRL